MIVAKRTHVGTAAGPTLLYRLGGCIKNFRKRGTAGYPVGGAHPIAGGRNRSKAKPVPLPVFY